MQIENQIKNYIAENLLFSDNGFTYDQSSSFLREGILDSIGVMELVTFVEQTFKIRVAPHEVTPSNFDSVNNLAGYIRRKQAMPAANDIATSSAAKEAVRI